MRAALRHRFFVKSLLLIALVGMLAGCSGRAFNVKNLAKSDVDMVADAHIRELRNLSHELLVKLYKRNPVQLSRGKGRSVTRRINQLFSQPNNYRFIELGNRRGNDAVRLAFDEDFKGDRVFALMVGINSMLNAAYDGKTELFLLDDLDQQKLYDSARNLEIITWRLNNRHNSAGEPFLLSNGYTGRVPNLSFERIFGKMIVLQDMMAKIVADRNNRAINSVVHSIASSTLLPVGI
ncbi:hypothetical protein [Motiliproteus sp. SC1-56]|uniref:hypothetical protein n=1 Tax=Motiliproteus sp. SC1-56 TaxID=2799565 RepID=UPI001F5C484A|nr:hypothetical protein [Motiliproteus sp. SC1-56]